MDSIFYQRSCFPVVVSIKVTSTSAREIERLGLVAENEIRSVSGLGRCELCYADCVELCSRDWFMHIKHKHHPLLRARERERERGPVHRRDLRESTFAYGLDFFGKFFSISARQNLSFADPHASAVLGSQSCCVVIIPFLSWSTLIALFSFLC